MTSLRTNKTLRRHRSGRYSRRLNKHGRQIGGAEPSLIEQLGSMVRGNEEEDKPKLPSESITDVLDDEQPNEDEKQNDGVVEEQKEEGNYITSMLTNVIGDSTLGNDNINTNEDEETETDEEGEEVDEEGEEVDEKGEEDDEEETEEGKEEETEEEGEEEETEEETEEEGEEEKGLVGSLLENVMPSTEAQTEDKEGDVDMNFLELNKEEAIGKLARQLDISPEDVVLTKDVDQETNMEKRVGAINADDGLLVANENLTAGDVVAELMFIYPSIFDGVQLLDDIDTIHNANIKVDSSKDNCEVVSVMKYMPYPGNKLYSFKVKTVLLKMNQAVEKGTELILNRDLSIKFLSQNGNVIINHPIVGNSVEEEVMIGDLL